MDPSEEQTVDVSAVPGLGDAIMAALAGAGVNLPGPVQNVGGGFGIAIDADIPAQIEALAIARDEGRITAAEFEAQRQRLLSG
ncbi:MAG: SHOCT domain-containing protein [Solirubrobacterales bacterium]|nr:SHOCT domain-containing protein [Solirubrobacterales bacterium]